MATTHQYLVCYFAFFFFSKFTRNIKELDFKMGGLKIKRYQNGNAAGVGLTTGVGAGSPPYTPLPGAASPDQTTTATTPLCHPISSNDGSYNHKKGRWIASPHHALHLLPLYPSGCHLIPSSIIQSFQKEKKGMGKKKKLHNVDQS